MLGISALVTDKSVALSDVVKQLFLKVSGLEMPAAARIYLTDELANIEYQLSVGTSDKIQLSSMVGVFRIAVDMIWKDFTMTDKLAVIIETRMNYLSLLFGNI